MKLIYICIALFVAFLGGITPIIHKHVLQNINKASILVFGGIAYCCCIFCLFIWNYDVIINDYSKITDNDLFWIMFAAIVDVFLANLLYLYVLKTHNSSLVAALIYSSPIFTLLLAYLFLNEKVDKYGILGIIFIILGVGCISMNDTMYELEEFIMLA